MESHRIFATTNAIGFCLLPSELIQCIILRLALPDVVRLQSVNKSISSMIADQDFVRDYNVQSSSAAWLFVYRKRWHRDSMLHGYTNCSSGWFKIAIADMLKPVIPPGEDLYLLAASGNVFLFALNYSREVISVNPVAKSVRRIPPSPLGPRGTSSWRRSGMKLLSSSDDHFRFLFAEMDGNQPVLFEYDSRRNQWSSTEVGGGEDEGSDVVGGLRRVSNRKKTIFLSAHNGRSGSVVIAARVGSSNDEGGDEGQAECGPRTVVVRPRFVGLGENEGGAVGFSWGNEMDRLHVYGDGKVMIIKSCAVVDGEKRRLMRVLVRLELWGLSSNGRQWELMSTVPGGLIERIKKPYGAMMGCLEEQRQGVVRAVLMSNLEGVWDVTWLRYDVECKSWDWLPIPDCKMKGANMAGIAFSSSGLTLKLE